MKRSIRKIASFWPAVALGVVIFGAAQYVSIQEIVNPLILPAPSDILASFWSSATQGRYFGPLASTLSAMAGGFLLTSAFAVTLAGLMVTFPVVERTVLPYLAGLQALPKIAVAPLVLLGFGFNNISKFVIVGIVAFFPILINTLQGLNVRESNRLELLNCLGADRLQIFRYIRLPGALPYIFAGFQIGLVFALIGAIVAEFVGAPDGIGVLLLQEKARFNAPGAWAILIVLMIVGALLRGFISWLERVVAPWSQEVSSM